MWFPRVLQPVDAAIARRPGLASAVLVVGASVWINLGSFHHLQHGDSIVPALVSLVQWTPFYWEQGRFGMLVPLIAIPIRHPLANLVFQNIVTCALGLAAFFVLARLFVRRSWFAVGTLSSAALLLLTGAPTRFEYLGTAQPYGTSLGLALLGTLGLLARDPRSPRAIVCGLLIVAAQWASPTSVLFIVPALLTAGALRSGQRTTRLVAALFWLGLGLAASQGLSRAYGESTPLVGPGSWGRTVVVMGRNAARAYLSEGLATLMGGALVLGVGLLFLRGGSRRRIAHLAPLVAGATAAAVGMASVRRVAEDPSERYAITSIFPLVVAAVAVWGEGARLLLARKRWRVAGSAVSVAILGGTVLHAYGLPSIAGLREDVDRRLGVYTQRLIEARATHFVGNYWKVWPAVFHFNLTLYERGSSLRLWGITHRSKPTMDAWANAPVWRLAAPADEPEILWWVRGYGLPFAAPVAVQGNVVLLRFIEGNRAPSGFPVPQRFVPGMEVE